MPAHTALPPNANFRLSDWSYYSGLIYLNGFDLSVLFSNWL